MNLALAKRDAIVARMRAEGQQLTGFLVTCDQVRGRRATGALLNRLVTAANAPLNS